jgi:hypothetical protein
MEDKDRKSAVSPKLSNQLRASLEEMNASVKHLEQDDLNADMMAVLLNHLSADLIDDRRPSALDGIPKAKVDWDKLKALSLE